MYSTSIELESCLSAGEVYLLDKRTSIETVVSLRGHCTDLVKLRAFLRLEKGDAIFQLPCHGIGMGELFSTGGTKRPRAKNKTAQEQGRI